MELKFEKNAIEALKIMENTNNDLYLTWKAWSWKSTLINFFISKTKKKVILLWTTWISAVNIWWQTIHRFFWIKPWYPVSLLEDTEKILEETDIIIIDEVSMMRSDLFDNIFYLLWKVKWKQVILVGDLFQLPPVQEKEFLDKEKTIINPQYTWYNKKYWSKIFFFESHFYDDIKTKKIELKKVYRQDDINFINMLNRLRMWDNSYDLLEYFNEKVIKEEYINKKSIYIATTNKLVNEKNEVELSKLNTEKLTSYAIIMWEYPEEIYPTDKYLNIKVWARVMTVSNHKNWNYQNWSLWEIVKINSNTNWIISIDIKFDNWWVYTIEKQIWENKNWFNEMWIPNIIWTFIQFPIKLAYAITIHKVQWKTFDNIVVDLWWGAFTSWQVYVALSRVKTYEWLQLLKPIKITDIKVDYRVLEFMKKRVN
jgi:ATP-dependent exoDNAse (exonuclease V) alpha subunit